MIREFTDHVTNQETWAKYFTNKRSLRKFEELVSTRTIEQALLADVARREADAKDDEVSTTPLQFIPTRGIMHEFSGNIADACWAEGDELAAEARPNMTSVIIKQRPGQASERLAGAGLLIETRDASTDEPVLLIRGLNPLENVITRLSSESFFETFTEYARGIAKARGMQLAVTVDDHSGGATSNRPTLWNYIYGRRAGWRQIQVPNAEVEFNGYGSDAEAPNVSSVFKTYAID